MIFMEVKWKSVYVRCLGLGHRSNVKYHDHESKSFNGHFDEMDPGDYWWPHKLWCRLFSKCMPFHLLLFHKGPLSVYLQLRIFGSYDTKVPKKDPLACFTWWFYNQTVFQKSEFFLLPRCVDILNTWSFYFSALR